MQARSQAVHSAVVVDVVVDTAVAADIVAAAYPRVHKDSLVVLNTDFDAL